MANEHTEGGIEVSFGVPDVPYSKVTHYVQAGDDFNEAAMNLVEFAAVLRERALVAFPFLDPANAPAPTTQTRSEQSGGRQDERPRPAQQRQGGQQGGRGRGPVTVAYCAEHDMAPVFMSAPKYNADGDRCYHPLDERDQYLREGRRVTNHNMYWRETVDRLGESNRGVPLPDTGGGGGRGNRDDDPAEREYDPF